MMNADEARMKSETWFESLVWSRGLDRSMFDLDGKVPFPTYGLRLKSVFGVVSQPDKLAVDWFSYLLEARKDFQLRLIASVFPACSTTEDDLGRFLVLQSCNSGRAKIRLFPERSLTIRATSLLCAIDVDNQARMVVGSCDNMGFADQSPSQIQVSAPVSQDLLDALCRTFDQVWSRSGELTEERIRQFPKLVLPAGTAEGARLWQSFLDACVPLDDQPDSVGDAPDVATAEQASSPTQEIGVKRLQPIERELSLLFRLGKIAILDESSRMKPLDVPLKPEWFGQESLIKAGSIKSSTSMKISPFEPNEFSKLEKLRTAFADLLAATSFSLANKVRWMPDRVQPRFWKEVDLLKRRWKTMLDEIVGSDPREFLNLRRTKIHNDAQEVYERFHPGQKIGADSLRWIEEEIGKRIRHLFETPYEPRFSFSGMQYEFSDKDGRGGSCAHAASLLLDMAKIQREAFLKTPSWQRRAGVVGDKEGLAQDLDLLRDIVRPDEHGYYGCSGAQEQLNRLEELASTSDRDLALCTILFEMITGRRPKDMDEESPVAGGLALQGIAIPEDDDFPF